VEIGYPSSSHPMTQQIASEKVHTQTCFLVQNIDVDIIQ